jgi:hypothetical protein
MREWAWNANARVFQYASNIKVRRLSDIMAAAVMDTAAAGARRERVQQRALDASADPVAAIAVALPAVQRAWHAASDAGRC